MTDAKAPAPASPVTPPAESGVPSAGSLAAGFLTRLGVKAAWVAVVFVGITLISFWVIHLAPGSPTDLATNLNPMVTPEARERLQKLYGLDQPLHVQYVTWVAKLARLDLGTSLSGDGRPVWDKIAERLPLTIGLNVTSLALTLLFAIPIGVYAAARRGKFFDRASTVFVFVGFAMPGFWLALLGMMAFGALWPGLPISGLKSLDFARLSAWDQFLDLARHLALPLFVTTFGSLAGLSRYMRSSMLEALRQDYILTARAKGLSEWRVLTVHALRNALLSLITILGLSLPGLIGGSVIIESLFSLPGLGQLFYQAVMARDYPLIMGNLVLGAVLTLAGNILADLGYALADPRVRVSGGEK